MVAEWTPLLTAHVAAAALSIPLGAWNLFRPFRGDRRHKILGYSWVVLMYFVAVSSFWIRDINEGRFSWIHILSVVTLTTLTWGLVAAIRGRIRTHRGMMRGTYFGLIGAFIGAMAAPVRALPTLMVEDLVTFLMAVLGVGLAFGLLVGLAYWIGGPPPADYRAPDLTK